MHLGRQGINGGVCLYYLHGCSEVEIQWNIPADALHGHLPYWTLNF